MSVIAGFTAGLLLITLSELGDKTFFIGAILAMRYPRRWVFLGVILALGGMTILSVGLGQVAALFPPHYVQRIAIALFLGFGLKLLLDASRSSCQGRVGDEETEALEAINSRTQFQQSSLQGHMVVLEALSLTFVAEWGDRTQLATMTLATTNHPLGVIAGAILGHAICAAIAITLGRVIAGCISERVLTGLSGGLFILFGLALALGISV